MSIQAKAVQLEWSRMADQETYYSLRDGPREQGPAWVIFTMARFLSPEHVDLMKDLAAKQKMIEAPSGRGAYMERVQGGRGVSARDERMRKHGKAIRELAEYDQVALRRVGRDGCLCFRGIVEGDTQAELSRRVGYPESSIRSIRSLVQLTLETLGRYHEENEMAGGAISAVQQKRRGLT